MIICPKCSRRFSDVPVLPLVCGCTKPKPNGWEVIHKRYAAAIESGQWFEPLEREWLTKEFRKLLPCATCGNSWRALEGSIDLSTAENAFRSLWEIHNTVSTEHVSPPKKPISFELCQALYLQQPSMDDCCIAVTSLSPNRIDRQTECLNSWKRLGLTVFAVQSSTEVADLKPLYSQVATWCIHSGTGAPTINRMADIAATIQKPILIVNADIEIRGEQRLIRDAIITGNLFGIRHNYHSQWWINKRELWGVDAFSINPDDAGQLPRLPLKIGEPVWDYWLLHHFSGQQINWISDPLLFHKSHKLNWTTADWDRNAEVFAKHYCIEDFDSMKFRRSFPFSG